MELQTITIKEYLNKKGISYKEKGGELIVKCLFGSCDDDSRENEAHLYFSAETGQYDCKKCGVQGNIITLAKHLGDNIKDVAINPVKSPKKSQNSVSDKVEKCNLALPDNIRQYLHARGITDKLINQYKLGWGNFYKKYWITIPVKDENGDFAYFKLRRSPEDTANPTKFRFWPAKSEASIYGMEMLKNEDDIVICEGEFDCLMLIKNGIPAITSTAGAGTFKDEWIEKLSLVKKIYVCFDKDEAGQRGADKVIAKLEDKLPKIPIYNITLPDRMTDGKDITDYFMKYDGNPDELMLELPKQVAGAVDTSKFAELTSADVINTLGLTIKQDNENKLLCFLGLLTAYTESSQFNISFNAPSSTGKSFIPTEIARLFPPIDVMELGHCSPTAFFHDIGEYNKEENAYFVNLSRRIIIFLDQPHNMLLERLRPLLSHDKKEIQQKITDKSQKGGLKTKNVFIMGYPVVIFCSAGLRIDEQEGTRFLLLSPETGQEKIRQAIVAKIKKETNNEAYKAWLNSDPARLQLKERIKAIKQEQINDVIIQSPEKIEDIFLGDKKILKPRHQRDITRLIDIIKAFALLNLWFRVRVENDIVASDKDIEEAVKVWENIYKSQEHNLPPFIYKLLHEVIIPAYKEKNDGVPEDECIGISKKELTAKHLAVYGRMLNEWYLRSQIQPMLESSGLISIDKDPDDKRKILITPVI